MTFINTDEWRAELDRVVAQVGDPMRNSIVDDRGFTVKDFMEHHHFKRTTALTRIYELEHNGIVKHIGYRSGHGGQKVYEIVKEKK